VSPSASCPAPGYSGTSSAVPPASGRASSASQDLLALAGLLGVTLAMLLYPTKLVEMDQPQIADDDLVLVELGNELAELAGRGIEILPQSIDEPPFSGNGVEHAEPTTDRELDRVILALTPRPKDAVTTQQRPQQMQHPPRWRGLLSFRDLLHLLECRHGIDRRRRWRDHACNLGFVCRHDLVPSWQFGDDLPTFLRFASQLHDRCDRARGIELGRTDALAVLRCDFLQNRVHVRRDDGFDMSIDRVTDDDAHFSHTLSRIEDVASRHDISFDRPKLCFQSFPLDAPLVIDPTAIGVERPDLAQHQPQRRQCHAMMGEETEQLRIRSHRLRRVRSEAVLDDINIQHSAPRWNGTGLMEQGTYRRIRCLCPRCVLSTSRRRGR